LQSIGSAAKLMPPSSERRSTQPEPTTTVLSSGMLTCPIVAVVPVGMPIQLLPRSSVRSRVPNSPAAKPRAPLNSTVRSVLPCGCGLPQFQPEWPTVTSAAWAAVSASARASAATDTSRASLFMASPFAFGDGSPATRSAAPHD
jgi:hypothetical protein